jgi:hypothetical protein
MAAITEPPETEETETATDDDEEEETLLDSWETDNEETLYELHDFEGHDQVLVVGGAEEEGETESVCIADNIEELDEAIEILTEIRERMVERASGKGKGKLRAVKT